MDHYQVLGVSRDAAQSTIKKAYRRLAMKHHPDKGGDQLKFQEVQQAYSVLSDPQQRQKYDNPILWPMRITPLVLIAHFKIYLQIYLAWADSQ